MDASDYTFASYHQRAFGFGKCNGDLGSIYVE